MSNFDPNLPRIAVAAHNAPACTASHSACGRIVVAVHAGNTAAAPASEVEAIIRSPTNMAAADVAAVEGRGHLALC